MSGSSIGNVFKVTTWGESHGEAIGAVIDGCPAGVYLNESDIQGDLDKRKPGSSKYATQRKESDNVKILSGTFEGKTTGTPISMIIQNADKKSSDYSEISKYYRPGHADYTYDLKYGLRDYRGGGRSSGRETATRVAAGAVAKKVLSSINIEIFSYTRSISDISIDYNNFSKEEIWNNDFCMPDKTAVQKVSLLMDKLMEEGDSAGGIVECVVSGLPGGIGEPVFSKINAELSKAVMSIGASKGIEFGAGFESSKLKGSQNNDVFRNEKGKIIKRTNNAGGSLGGITDGSELLFRVAFKPTPSIYKVQDTVNKNLENIEINIKGRHDPVIVPRAVVVIEAMTAIVLADFIIINLGSTIDNIKKFYAD